MSVQGLCEVCTETVEDACDRCGRLVCARHYDQETGLCTDCLADSEGRPTDSGETDHPDGVDEYRF